MENEFLFSLLMPMVRVWLEGRNEEMSKDGIFVEAMTNNFLRVDKKDVLKILQWDKWENALEHLLVCAYDETITDIGDTNMEGE